MEIQLKTLKDISSMSYQGYPNSKAWTLPLSLDQTVLQLMCGKR